MRRKSKLCKRESGETQSKPRHTDVSLPSLGGEREAFSLSFLILFENSMLYGETLSRSTSVIEGCRRRRRMRECRQQVSKSEMFFFVQALIRRGRLGTFPKGEGIFALRGNRREQAPALRRNLCNTRRGGFHYPPVYALCPRTVADGYRIREKVAQAFLHHSFRNDEFGCRIVEERRRRIRALPPDSTLLPGRRIWMQSRRRTTPPYPAFCFAFRQP